MGQELPDLCRRMELQLPNDPEHDNGCDPVEDHCYDVADWRDRVASALDLYRLWFRYLRKLPNQELSVLCCKQPPFPLKQNQIR